MEYSANNKVVRHNFNVASWLNGGAISALIFKHSYLKKVNNGIQIVDENVCGYYYDAVKVKIILKYKNNAINSNFLEIIDSLDNLYDFSEMLNYLEFSMFYLVNHCGIINFDLIKEAINNKGQYENFELLIQDLASYLFACKNLKQVYNDNDFKNLLFKIIICVRNSLKDIYNGDLNSIDDCVKFCNCLENFFLHCNMELQALLKEMGLNE